jgi:hypothetical protein
LKRVASLLRLKSITKVQQGDVNRVKPLWKIFLEKKLKGRNKVKIYTLDLWMKLKN